MQDLPTHTHLIVGTYLATFLIIHYILYYTDQLIKKRSTPPDTYIFKGQYLPMLMELSKYLVTEAPFLLDGYYVITWNFIVFLTINFKKFG